MLHYLKIKKIANERMYTDFCPLPPLEAYVFSHNVL